MSDRVGGQPHSEMPFQARVRLLEVEPDLGRFLSAEQQAEAEPLVVPVLHVEKGPVDLDAELLRARAFAAVVLDGMLVHRLRVGDQPALRLLGPGDVLALSGTQRTLLLAESSHRVAAPTGLALLGDAWLVAARRWPLLVPGLQTLMTAQAERLSAQFVICQLPRVDQRLLTMLWLLAESWGHVTSVGTTLPLSLTHDVLGELIGARRSTVTLALTELSDRGAIVRQDRGWLLLEPPPTGAETPSEIADPSLLVDVGSSWAAEETHPMLGAEASRTELRETVARLRQEHRHRVERYEQRIGRLSLARQRAGDSRRRITQEATARRRAPSS